MTGTLRVSIAIALLFVFSLIVAHPAHAQIGISGGQAAGIVAAGAGVATGIGLIVYFTLRSPRSITGCVVSDSGGTAIQSDNDRQVLMLAGDASAVPVGDRVTIKGKRSKGTAGRYLFTVKSVQKDYGACALTHSSVASTPAQARH